MDELRKYPRTPHIAGSRLQVGDEDLAQINFRELEGQPLVVEEKLDGSNSAVSFSTDGRLLLQSRGHYLTGGPRERQFDLFKAWANAHLPALWSVLGSRYIMYGEWLYAKHTIFYDALPDYFMEFDIFDRKTELFLGTNARKELLAPLNFVHSAPVLFQGQLSSKVDLHKLLGRSTFIQEGHLEALRKHAEGLEQNAEKVLFETDPSPLMEGLYIKIEEENKVISRFKWVRKSFHQVVEKSGEHWMNRKIINNLVGRKMEKRKKGRR